MPIESIVMEDFSGGESDYVSSLEFEENQFASLSGFVYDKQKRLRTQWGGALWSAGETDES